MYPYIYMHILYKYLHTHIVLFYYGQCFDPRTPIVHSTKHAHIKPLPNIQIIKVKSQNGV